MWLNSGASLLRIGPWLSKYCAYCAAHSTVYIVSRVRQYCTTKVTGTCGLINGMLGISCIDTRSIQERIHITRFTRRLLRNLFALQREEHIYSYASAEGRLGSSGGQPNVDFKAR